MPAQSPVPGKPTLKPDQARRLDWAGLAARVILISGTVAVYCRTFSVPLLFDDQFSITENLSIRKLWPIWPVLAPPNVSGAGGRPLLNLSFALNYAFGGTGVFGYHLVNLLVHTLAALTLFGLLRRTLLRPVLAERFGSSATALALAVSAIWAWHPVQTVSVTYLSQRAESLMGLCYLLTLYCFLRGAESEAKLARLIWFSLTVLACLAGIGTKEVIVTAPLLVFLYDRTFVSGSFSNAWRRHWPLLAALTATWLPLGFLMTGLHRRSVGFGLGATWWAYGLFECRVVLRYILIVFWPHPLIFDYGAFEVIPLSELWPYVLILGSLLAASIFALRRSPGAGFAACWFFLILVPTSSIVPVVGQPMAENRLYLSLAGVAGLVVLGGFRLAGRWSYPAFAIVATALGLASVQRNLDYTSEQSIWSDTVAKNPDNPRAHNNLAGVVLKIPGRVNEAVAQYEEALRLNPDYADAHNNLGNAWSKLPGRMNDAIAQYEEALRLKPDFAEAHNNLGSAITTMPGRLNDAIAQYEEALRLEPDLAEAHCNLGDAFAIMPGRANDAIAQYDEALRLKPDYADSYINRAAIYLKEGDFIRALADCNEAVRLKPGFDVAHRIRADTYAANGDYDHAIVDYREAIRLQPESAEAYNNLAWLWATCFEDRIRNGRNAEEYARKACDLTEWKNPECIDTLAAACAEAGDFSEAVKWENRYLELSPPKDGAESARQRISLFAAKVAYHEGKKPN
jgi:tetratricopeptide (TPR) repeat protein